MRVCDNKIIFILCIFFLALLFTGNISFSKENECLICHKVKREPKILESGEKLFLYVNPEEYKISVHGNIDCIFCHLEIKPDHPKPTKIKNKKEYTEQLAKNCLKCHPTELISKSPAHAKVIKRKDVNCVDCHGSHYIKSLKEWKKTVSNTNYCLMCHEFSIIKTLSSGEKLPLEIKKSEVQKSVHSKLECINCHYNFSKTQHPLYDFKNRNTYVTELSKKICQRCHTDESLKKKPAHYSISKTAPCIECHGAHNVKPAKVSVKAPEKEYCMSCHHRALSKKMENGEILSLKVDEAQLLYSAHNKLKCSDCHKNFSLITHPTKSYKSITDYRSKAQEICANCHKKESLEYNKSIHAKAFLKGNKEAPDCLKCHGYHNTPKIISNLTSRYELCIKCHDKENKSFAESIHYKALKEGKKEAPVCSDCHKAHKVLPVNFANLNDSCLKCHKNIKTSHNKWLYNPPFKLESFVDVHFAGSSCAVCHTSGERAIVLTLFTPENKPLTLEEISKVTNWDIETIKTKLDLNNDNLIEKDELKQFVYDLKEKVKAKLKSRLDVVNANDAHKILSKDSAVKDCAVCHDPKAQFTGRIEINKEGEKLERIALERTAINSFYAIPNIKDFYVLGLTKINILDILFIIGLIAGIGVVTGHVFLRIITIPVRRKKREGR